MCLLYKYNPSSNFQTYVQQDQVILVLHTQAWKMETEKS